MRRTVEYARERRTFGSPIGRYQSVQHRLVEHTVIAAQMTDLVAAAAEALGRGDADVVDRLVVAEIYGAERSQEVISDCIQLTGATGFTWEYGLHFALRRSLGNAQLVGGARRARADLAAAAGW